MATIGQVKDLLKKELEPLHSKLETMSTEFSELRASAQLFSDKYPGRGGTPIYGLYRYVPRNRV